jgi:hypothetical protein
MQTDKTQVLIENFREWLRLYERGLVWAIAASISYLLISRTTDGEHRVVVPLLYSEIDGMEAALVALLLFFIFGGFALSAVRRAKVILDRLRETSVPPETIGALTLFPSLATHHNGFFRVGSVLLPPLFMLASFILELSETWEPNGLLDHPWGGFLMFWLIVLSIYGSIAVLIWEPLGVEPDGPRQLESLLQRLVRQVRRLFQVLRGRWPRTR